ncbi:MAG TPA: spherulation-specific family 4 protein [Pirellulaceae bacterium]|nr:spherulation-specific family 4 protein [Pirellulaceae bacterium]
MSRLCVPLAAAVILTSIARGSATAQEQAKATSIRLIVPAYFYPSRDGLAAWKELLASASETPIVAIVNPASGPGRRVDPNYEEVMRLARSSKAKLIGYVTLSYAKRPAAEVMAKVDAWVKFYPGIQGIFFDEQPSGAEHAAFAGECFAHAAAKIDKALIVSNPGTSCAREYAELPQKPVIVLYERGTGLDKYQPPEWTKDFAADRFSVLLYGVKSKDEMRQAFRDAPAKRVGYFYVTDAEGRNPWNRLPGYWKEEVEAAKDKRAHR